ncbi:MAG: hypothetical protein ABIJ09_21180 [Pseudomonadota bacterium]
MGQRRGSAKCGCNARPGSCYHTAMPPWLHRPSQASAVMLGLSTAPVAMDSPLLEVLKRRRPAPPPPPPWAAVFGVEVYW